MTYDELLAKINHIDSSADFIMDESEQYFFKALRAVVELHKPFSWNSNNTQLCCIACADFDDGDVVPATYPCPTIQAIEKELA
jgi:hypothetical protein